MDHKEIKEGDRKDKIPWLLVLELTVVQIAQRLSWELEKSSKYRNISPKIDVIKPIFK